MKLLLATFLALSPFVSAAFRDYSFGDESYHLLVSREASRESYRDYSFGDENYNLLVSREAPPELSACSASCLAEAMPFSGCNPTDAACLCTSADFAAHAGACLTTNCTIIDALTSQKYSAITCNAPVRNNGSLTRGVTWSMFTLATICFIARLASRLPALGGTGYGWDDYTIIFSWALLIPSDIILNMMTWIGLGRDIWMLPDYNVDITAILFWFYVSEYTYVVLLSTTKISILLLYLRMWPDAGSTPGPRWFHRCCIALIGVLFMYASILMVVLGLECQPLSYAWSRWNPVNKGYCIDQNQLIYASASLNILFDILVIILPVPRLLSLQIPTRKKLAVVATFLIGLFVTLCSIIRLRYLAAFGSAANVTWLYNPIGIWSNVEINLGVVCACMPALAGLMQRLYIMITGNELTTMRSGRHGGGNGRSSAFGMNDEDDNSHPSTRNRYELEEKSRSFSDGTVKYYGHRDHPGNKPAPRAYVDDAVSLDESLPPHTTNEVPRMGEYDLNSATQKMIGANTAAFSHFKKNSQ